MDSQHFYPGAECYHGVCVFVGKPKVRQFINDAGNGLMLRVMVTLAFRGADGVVRRARFCQSIADRFTPGKSDDYRPVPLSNPSDWPATQATT